MTIIYDVEPDALVKETAELLKEIKEISPPEWAQFIKTGVHKERPPVQDDWWYMRVASILRKVKILGPIGTSKLRTKYGGKKNRGHKPERFYKGSGSVIRHALQQLEKAGLIKYAEKGLHKGRIITPAGEKILAEAAKKVR